MLAVLACNQGVPDKPSPDGKEMSTTDLVAAHCGRCHAVPQATDLDKKTWEHYVLPRMGYFMGIYSDSVSRESLLEQGATRLVEQNIFPIHPIISTPDWQRLQDYYLSNAPSRLETEPMELQKNGLPFNVQFPNTFLSPPSISLIQFASEGTYFAGDINKKQLFWLDQNHNAVGAISTTSAPVSLTQRSDALWLTTMGSFSPTDLASGQLTRLPLISGEPPSIEIDHLQRPVDAKFFDLDKDGTEEIIIAEYGKWTGRLAYWAKGATQWEAVVLREKEGAIRSEIADLNRDGVADIIALFGQGDEGVWLFLQEENGQFSEQPLLRFPPSYGSSYFQLIDWDSDGHMDILYTNGDNADYPPIIKPYHGIRLFRNTGNLGFEEKWFLPMPGAYKAVTADFDQDGDLDIAAISFFPDFARQAEQGFVYFEQTSENNFQAISMPQATTGRWISMDVGDLNGDNKEDLILGSLAFEVIPNQGELDNWIKNGLGWLALINTSN